MRPNSPIVRVSTLEEALRWGRVQLRALGKIEARVSAERLLEEVLKLDRLHLYIEARRTLRTQDFKKYEKLIFRRKKRIPVDYLFGRTHFWNEILEVGSGCLIPRPSTEVLVEKFLEKPDFGSDRKFSFLDLGCGSGAIGVAILRSRLKAFGYFADISQQALDITRKNLRHYGLLKRSRLMRSDLLNQFYPSKEKWDVILSNPPYLSARDLKMAQPEILKEPLLALDGGQDGLDLYRKIAVQAADFLNPGGLLVLEMGKGQAGRIRKFCSKRFFEIEVFKDYAKIDRVLMARKHG